MAVLHRQWNKNVKITAGSFKPGTTFPVSQKMDIVDNAGRWKKKLT